jgi:Holliday junction resolvase RusA-like endonuclease
MDLLGHIAEVQALGLPDESPTAAACERLLLALLDADGPPPAPVPGFSSEANKGIARSPKGRPLFLCESWQTGEWTCLLLDLPPVTMGRPIFLPNPAGKGPGRTVTDYQSQKFQRRIGAACAAFDLPKPANPCKVVVQCNATRTFVAWRQLPDPAPDLRGDLDNYAKNILDGLQRCSLLANDRIIADLKVARVFMPESQCSLESRLIEHLATTRAAFPEMNQRELARAARLSQRDTRRLLRMIAAPSPKPGRRKRTPAPDGA